MNYKATTLDQLQRERAMLEDGHDRFMQRQAKLKDLSIDKAHSKILVDAIPSVTQNIIERLTEAEEKGKQAGRPYNWLKDLKPLNPELLAYLGLVSCMEGLGLRATRTRTLKNIGGRIEMEHFGSKLYDHDRDFAKRVTDVALRASGSGHRRKQILRGIAAAEGFTPERWKEERLVQAAAPILSAVLEASGIFEIYEVIKKGKTYYYLGMTDQASIDIADVNADISWSEPMFTPMVTRPRDWVDLDSGVYLDPALASLTPLVRKTSGKQRGMIRSAIRTGRMQPAIAALNTIQRTSYVINDYTMAAVEWCWEMNIQPGSTFPARQRMPHHKYPDDYEELNDELKHFHRKKAHEVRMHNRDIDSGISLMHSDLKTAKDLQQHECFYLPHSFDFRGRVYPIPHFNQHRNDHVKSLFLFSERKRIGERGAYWIAVQVATTGDFDRMSKASFAERVEWVMDNAERLALIGNDFEATYDDGNAICWSKADKPFQFLAACRDFFGFWQQGIDYCSGLGIALDGSNSGIQHFAAQSKTETDGALVNLIPAERPQDIYQAVADKVTSSLEKDTSNEIASEWLRFGITRKHVKRNVMTYCYSSGHYGFTEQLMTDLMKPLHTEVLSGLRDKHPFDDPHKAAMLLSSENMNAIRIIIKGAADGMRFYQKIANILAKRGETMSWFTPIGFPVDNCYYKTSPHRVRLYLYDKDAPSKLERKSMVLMRPTNRIDSRGCTNAISPNMIHSMDSTHLLMTVLACASKNVRNFNLVHDSFSTHPSDTDTLFKTVREEFVSLYSECMYTNILNQIKSHFQLTEEELAQLPAVPEKGTLDLSDILESDYCFA